MEFNKELLNKYKKKVNSLVENTLVKFPSIISDDLKSYLYYTIYNCTVKYNKDKGASFNTYLTSALHRAINRFISNECYTNKKPKIFIEDKQLEDNDDRGFFDYKYLSSEDEIDNRLDTQAKLKWILKQRNRFYYKAFNIFVDYYFNQLTKQELINKYRLTRESINIHIRKVKAKLKELMKAEGIYE